MSLLDSNPVYKPFSYPWAYDAWLIQQQIHWLPEEVPLADDVKDWHRNLTAPERNLLTQIFRFFTQSDVEVNNCYMRHYSRVFRPTEIQMMLAAFSNMEHYKEMKDKYDFLQGFGSDSKIEIARMLAVFGAFTEGLQLFASFAILLNFPRFNKMKGMGQIVSWSVRDETLHTNSMIRLFTTFITENPEIWTDSMRHDLYRICNTVVSHEDAFVGRAFELGGVEGRGPREVKKYVRYVADRRLIQLGLQPMFRIEQNPLPWVEDMLNGVEHTNFFENRSTEYSRAATRGTWDEAFG